MSLKALQEYSFVSKYAKYDKTLKRRETWNEAVGRVEKMHLEKYPQITEEIKWAFGLVRQKRVLGSQRALQFGGEAILRKHPRIYNCVSGYCDRIRFFQEVLYLLLCGCGVGFSVQKHHINKLPRFNRIDLSSHHTEVFQIPDTIEGWSDALGILLSTYFDNDEFSEFHGKTVEFDYSLIRPKGAPLSYGGKAPGPEPLQRSLEIIRDLLDQCLLNGQTGLKPINAYDIIMHSSDAVLAGGIRRSATICLFSIDDLEMMQAKTGNWFIDNPQRGRSNNSVVLEKNKIDFVTFQNIMDNVKQFGEPGFAFVDDLEVLFNPCQSSSSIVMTPLGLRTFGDIQAGDIIWSESGWTKIMKKWSNGIQPVYKYKTRAGYFLGTENHRVVQNGQKLEVKYAESIDILSGNFTTDKIVLDEKIIMDGLIIGDGTKASNNLVCLIIGEDDQDYFDSEVKNLIYKSVAKECIYKVDTSIKAIELPVTYLRTIPDRFKFGDKSTICSFLRGLYSANGSVVDNRITLKQASFKIIEDVQLMLSYLGIFSYYTINKPSLVQFRNGEYLCKQSYDLNISRDREKFVKLIGFIQKYKNDKIDITKKRNFKKESYEIVEKEYVGDEEVFDITVDNESHTYWTGGHNVSNCVEIALYGYTEDGRSGFQACNLCEINGKKIKSIEDFKEVCTAAAIIGTCQAGYTDFGYLGPATKEITDQEALLGVSITGIMDSPDIILDPNTQQEMAQLVKRINKEIAAKIGINPAARTTCVKPAGSTSCVLGTASGIHPHHAKRYFRRVQSNKMEAPGQLFRSMNPLAVEESVWSANNTDNVLTFCIEVPDGAKTKNDLSAIELLDIVKNTQDNWVTYGKDADLCVKPWLMHNVSNTIHIKDNEWEDVTKYIYQNQNHFSGISLLPSSGDLDYPQAPFTHVSTPREILQEYGDGSLMASGLIVDGLRLFDNNLFAACDFVRGLGDSEADSSRLDWKRRVIQFAKRYCDNNLKRCCYLMKEVNNWKLWVDLHREYQTIDYTTLIEEEDNTKISETIACAGGVCQLIS